MVEKISKLRRILSAVTATDKYGKPLYLCGEMLADPVFFRNGYEAGIAVGSFKGIASILDFLVADCFEGFLDGYTLPDFKACIQHSPDKEAFYKEVNIKDNQTAFCAELQQFNEEFKVGGFRLNSFRLGNYKNGLGYSTIFNVYGNISSLSITKATKENELTPFINASISIDELSVYSPKSKVRLGMIVTSDLPDLISRI